MIEKIKSLFKKGKTNTRDTAPNLVVEFNNTFESDDAASFVTDTADFAIGRLVDDETIASVPFVGKFYAVYKVTQDVKSYRLAQKVFRFVYQTKEIPRIERSKFIHEYAVSNCEDGAAALLSVIDRLDNQNKVDVIANLMKARVEEKISISEFNRLISCLDRIPFTDIQSLKEYVIDRYIPGETEILNTCGLLFTSVQDFDESRDLYRLNHNGVLLLKYGIGMDIDIPTSYVVQRPTFATEKDLENMVTFKTLDETGDVDLENGRDL